MSQNRSPRIRSRRCRPPSTWRLVSRMLARTTTWRLLLGSDSLHCVFRSQVRPKSFAARATAATALLVVLGSAPLARAQLSAIPPPLAKLTGGYLWGSLGYHDVAHPDRFLLSNAPTFVRGGFSAM